MSKDNSMLGKLKLAIKEPASKEWFKKHGSKSKALKKHINKSDKFLKTDKNKPY